MVILTLKDNFAKALFKSDGTSEQVQDREKNLNSIAQLLTEYPRVLNLLSSPKSPIEERIQFLEKMLNIKLDKVLKKLLGMILKKRKVSQIPRIAHEYHKLVLAELKEAEIEVVTAQPLNDTAKSLLKKKLETKLEQNINLVETVDDSLLAGFTILIRNQLLDLSLRGKLDNLKTQLLRSAL